MTEAMCPRLFEVEALRDGRLGVAEKKSFERHLATCPVCAREAVALDQLAAAARVDVNGGGGADDLRVVRERTRLLAAFDRALLSTPRPRRAWRWLVPAAAAAVVGGFLVHGRVRPGAVERAHAAQADVRADGNAVWSKRAGAGNREEIALQRGLLWIHVDHSLGDGRLVVLLPDGELEDVGTTFTVSADGGRTTRVAVEEGRVSLRLRGHPAIDVGPGDVWLSTEKPAPTPPLTVLEPWDSERPEPRRISRALRAHSSTVPAAPDPLVEFRGAMEALRAGDNSRAAAGFTRFLVEHPGDPMAEDAAYLRVIALQRAGATGDVKRAAEEYLRRFPTGFRRAEIEKLSR